MYFITCNGAVICACLLAVKCDIKPRRKFTFHNDTFFHHFFLWISLYTYLPLILVWSPPAISISCRDVCLHNTWIASLKYEEKNWQFCIIRKMYSQNLGSYSVKKGNFIYDSFFSLSTFPSFSVYFYPFFSLYCSKIMWKLWTKKSSLNAVWT